MKFGDGSILEKPFFERSLYAPHRGCCRSIKVLSAKEYSFCRFGTKKKDLLLIQDAMVTATKHTQRHIVGCVWQRTTKLRRAHVLSTPKSLLEKEKLATSQ